MFNENPTDAQVADACMWRRHDFGLLSAEERASEMDVMREYWRAIWKACNTPGRGVNFAEMTARGREAWADVPDASTWVEEQRGNVDEGEGK